MQLKKKKGVGLEIPEKKTTVTSKRPYGVTAMKGSSFTFNKDSGSFVKCRLDPFGTK